MPRWMNQSTSDGCAPKSGKITLRVSRSTPFVPGEVPKRFRDTPPRGTPSEIVGLTNYQSISLFQVLDVMLDSDG